jgi:hypothetical protein
MDEKSWLDSFLQSYTGNTQPQPDRYEYSPMDPGKEFTLDKLLAPQTPQQDELSKIIASTASPTVSEKPVTQPQIQEILESKPIKTLTIPKELPAQQEIPAFPTQAPTVSAEPITDQEMKAALDEQRKNLAYAQIMQAGSDIGRAIVGRDKDESFSSGMTQLANLPVEQLKQQREANRKMLEDKLKKTSYDYNVQKNDPNSAVSKAALELRTKFLKDMKMFDMADKVQKANLSATQLEDTFGELNLNNLYTQYESGQQKKLQMEMMNKERQENRETKLNNKQQQIAKGLADKINQIDKEVDYSTLATNTNEIQNRLSSGKYNGVDDILSIYALIKAIDPGSVVRESEVSLVFKGDSPFAKAGNLPNKLLKGDLASPQMRQKVMDALSRLETTRRTQFDTKINPYLKQAEKAGINREDIDITTGLRPKQAPVKAMGMKKIQAPNGKSYMVPEDKVDVALKAGGKLME